MATVFDRDALLDAFDRIGRAAVAVGTRLQIAVYGGSAKCNSRLGMILSENRKATFRDHALLASSFRFATEDVDIADIGHDWPDWLTFVVAEIARDKGWSEEWFNDGVTFHLSPLADHAKDHLEFGTFPRDGSPSGLVVSVPTAEYLLAMKLKAFRTQDVLRGDTERLDILNLMDVVGILTADKAIAVLGKYFPISAASSEKQRFLLKNLDRSGKSDAPKYPR